MILWLMAYVTLLILLLLTLVLICAGCIYLMALCLLRPPRMNDGKAIYVLRRLSPGDLGMNFEECAFHVRDEQTGKPIRLAAWWIPAREASHRTVMLVHGYSDAKVGAIAWAPMLQSLGLNILAFDLRAHGESEGRYCTGGFHERNDLNHILNEIRATRPNATQQIYLFGISMGGAVVSACAVHRDDLAGVILECPFACYEDAAMTHAANVGLPGKSFQLAALRLAQRLGRCDFSQIRPADLIPQIPAPLLVIQAQGDHMMTDDARNRIAKACAARDPSRTIFWEVPDAGHVLAICAGVEEYRAKLEQFLAHST